MKHVITLKAVVSPGRSYVVIEYDALTSLCVFMVHRNGVVSYEKYFGNTTGSGAVIACIGVYLILLACFFIAKYAKSVKESLYRYDNILYWVLSSSLFSLPTQGTAFI